MREIDKRLIKDLSKPYYKHVQNQITDFLRQKNIDLNSGATSHEVNAQSGNVSKHDYNQQRVSSSSVDRILKKELHQFGVEEEDSDQEVNYSPVKMTQKQLNRISQKIEMLPRFSADIEKRRKSYSD